MVKTQSDLGMAKGSRFQSILRGQMLPAAALGAVMVGWYALGTALPPGIATYAISIPALVIIIITALARVNDMSTKLTGSRWNIRRVGLIMAGVGAAGTALIGVAPSWNETILFVGFALTWLTTPGMPPWWKWIAGQDIVAVDETR